MKETKTYCDICKNEFTESSFTLVLALDRYTFCSSLDRKFEDVCGPCTTKIAEFIDEFVKDERSKKN